MPRTKMVKKKSVMKSRGTFTMNSKELSIPVAPNDSVSALVSVENDSVEELRERFETFYNKKLEDHRQAYENAQEQLKQNFMNLIQSLPQSFINATLNARFDETLLGEVYGDQNQDPNRVVPKVRQSRTRKIMDDSAFEFKRPKTPRMNLSSTRKRSNSAPAPNPALPPVQTDSVKTPVMSTRRQVQTPIMSSRKQIQSVTTITPKVALNTPLSIMRRPGYGEMAFSSSGSPLLIGPVSCEDIPTVSVPLQDGRVFSILPDPTAPPPDLPDFDEETKNYLKTLREHLEILAPSSPRSRPKY